MMEKIIKNSKIHRFRAQIQELIFINATAFSFYLFLIFLLNLLVIGFMEK